MIVDTIDLAGPMKDLAHMVSHVLLTIQFDEFGARNRAVDGDPRHIKCAQWKLDPCHHLQSDQDGARWGDLKCM